MKEKSPDFQHLVYSGTETHEGWSNLPDFSHSLSLLSFMKKIDTNMLVVDPFTCISPLKNNGGYCDCKSVRLYVGGVCMYVLTEIYLCVEIAFISA